MREARDDHDPDAEQQRRFREFAQAAHGIRAAKRFGRKLSCQLG